MTKAKRVVVLTDSMSLTRVDMQNWECTYINRLRQKFPLVDFIHFVIGKVTIRELGNQLKRYYQFTDPDVIILHCGIVDCAPRALRRWEQKVIARIPVFCHLVYRSRVFLRKFRSIQYTPPNVFERALLEIKGVFDVPLISIGMAPPTENYEKKIPRISIIMKSYNGILQKHTNFIDLKDFPRKAVGGDDYHYNELGHKIVYKKLSVVLGDLLAA